MFKNKLVQTQSPKIEQLFDTLEDGEQLYKKYAHTVGFSMRCSSESKNKEGVKRKNKEGVKRWKYFVCSKEGYKPVKEEIVKERKSTNNIRRRSLTREGCNAKVAFKLLEQGKYELSRFHESHTHVLVTPKKRQLLRSTRKANPNHRNIVYAYIVEKILGHPISPIKEQLGSYENVGCTQKDFQNCLRDLKTLTKDTDACVFVDNLKRKKKRKSFILICI